MLAAIHISLSRHTVVMDRTEIGEPLPLARGSDLERAAKLLEANLVLVTTPSEADRFTELVNHVVGEGLADWSRAAELNRGALERIPYPANARDAIENLSAACFMAGRLTVGLATDLDAMVLAGEDALACAIAVRLRTALYLLHTGEREGGIGLFGSALRAVHSLGDHTSRDRTIAAMVSNVTSILLALPDRSDSDSQLLEQGALTARTFWLRAGSSVNQERADYLVALTYNALRRHGLAREAATHALATIDTHGGREVDRAFLLVELAFANRQLGRLEEASRARETAKELSTHFEDPSIKRRFADASAKLG